MNQKRPVRGPLTSHGRPLQRRGGAGRRPRKRAQEHAGGHPVRDHRRNLERIEILGGAAHGSLALLLSARTPQDTAPAPRACAHGQQPSMCSCAPLAACLAACTCSVAWRSALAASVRASMAPAAAAASPAVAAGCCACAARMTPTAAMIFLVKPMCRNSFGPCAFLCGRGAGRAEGAGRRAVSCGAGAVARARARARQHRPRAARARSPPAPTSPGRARP